MANFREFLEKTQYLINTLYYIAEDLETDQARAEVGWREALPLNIEPSYWYERRADIEEKLGKIQGFLKIHLVPKSFNVDIFKSFYDNHECSMNKNGRRRIRKPWRCSAWVDTIIACQDKIVERAGIFWNFRHFLIFWKIPTGIFIFCVEWEPSGASL